jgi:hypothetical protein
MNICFSFFPAAATKIPQTDYFINNRNFCLVDKGKILAEKSKLLLSNPSRRSLLPFMWPWPSWLNHLLKVPPLITVTLRFWRNTYIHAIKSFVICCKLFLFFLKCIWTDSVQILFHNYSSSIKWVLCGSAICRKHMWERA